MPLIAPTSRRCKLLYVSKELLDTIDGIPDGCTIEAVTFDFQSDCWILRLQHHSFEEVPDGHMIPTATVTVHKKLFPLIDLPIVKDA
jgi:hypothetical protein